MINIEKIEKQAQDLQACVNNYKAAANNYAEINAKYLSSILDFGDCVLANDIKVRCENTLKTQLRIMADDNREEVRNG